MVAAMNICRLSKPAFAFRCSAQWTNRLTSAQKVRTTGAFVTMGWLKCAGASWAFRFRSRVTTTLYNCMFPVLEAREATSSNSHNNSSGTSCSVY